MLRIQKGRLLWRVTFDVVLIVTHQMLGADDRVVAVGLRTARETTSLSAWRALLMHDMRAGAHPAKHILLLGRHALDVAASGHICVSHVEARKDVAVLLCHS